MQRSNFNTTYLVAATSTLPLDTAHLLIKTMKNLFPAATREMG
jgi:hypothetical protein